MRRALQIAALLKVMKVRQRLADGEEQLMVVEWPGKQPLQDIHPCAWDAARLQRFRQPLMAS